MQNDSEEVISFKIPRNAILTSDDSRSAALKRLGVTFIECPEENVQDNSLRKSVQHTADIPSGWRLALNSIGYFHVFDEAGKLRVYLSQQSGNIIVVP